MQGIGGLSRIDGDWGMGILGSPEVEFDSLSVVYTLSAIDR